MSLITYQGSVTKSRSRSKPPRMTSIIRKHFNTILSNSTSTTTTSLATRKISSKSPQDTRFEGKRLEDFTQINKGPSECLTYFLEDPTHTTAGYSRSYTNSMILTCGFPQDESGICDLEDEIVAENTSRVLCIMKGVDVYLKEF